MLRRFFLVATLMTMNAFADDIAPRQIDYRQIDGRALGAYVFSSMAGSSHATHPTILLFHGGGWKYGEPSWTFDAARKFAALGMTAVSIEYRLADAHATPADSVDDICAAFDWIVQRATALHVDKNRIAAYGVSAGGQLLLAASARCTTGRPNAVLLLSPVVDLGDGAWFSELLRGGKSDDYSPMRLIDTSTPPTLIVQGDKDDVTPIDAAKRYCAAMLAQSRICELALYPDVGHVLTRDLADQVNGDDIDETALHDSEQRMRIFLQAHGILPTITATP
jgi:acetyl esterase